MTSHPFTHLHYHPLLLLLLYLFIPTHQTTHRTIHSLFKKESIFLAQWSHNQSSFFLSEIFKLHGILHGLEYYRYGEFHRLDCRKITFQILYCRYKKLIVQQSRWRDDSTRIYSKAYDDTILQNDFTSFFKINSTISKRLKKKSIKLSTRMLFHKRK